jgi:hypothetical protein
MMVGHFFGWSCIGQAVGGEWDMTDLIGGAGCPGCGSSPKADVLNSSRENLTTGFTLIVQI